MMPWRWLEDGRIVANGSLVGGEQSALVLLILVVASCRYYYYRRSQTVYHRGEPHFEPHV